MTRTKANADGHTQHLSLLPHADTWMLCPLMALACHCLMNSHSQDRIYSADPKKIASYMNAFIKQLGQYQGLDLSSHSCRHSGVGFCCSHFQVLVHWVIQKGDWVLDSINTFFEYLAFSSKSDMYVSRIMSGYAEIDQGLQQRLYFLTFLRRSASIIFFDRRPGVDGRTCRDREHVVRRHERRGQAVIVRCCDDESCRDLPGLSRARRGSHYWHTLGGFSP